MLGTSIHNKYLQIWEQAGEHPYEVLQEMGTYDTFLELLEREINT